MKIDKIDLYTSSRVAGKKKDGRTKLEKGYGLTVHRYTLPQYVWGTVYHWYDMRFPARIPGWSRFEQWLANHGAEHRITIHDPKPRWRDRLLAWTVNQDLRCPFNRSYGEEVARVDVDEETYWDLHKKIHRYEAKEWSKYIDRKYKLKRKKGT